MKKGTVQYAYLVTAMTWIIYIIVNRLLAGFNAIPFRFEEFLFFHGSIWEPVVAAWPVFAVGFLLNLVLMIKTTNPPEVQESAPTIPINGFITSFLAGLLEEICFRWVMLFGMMGVIFGLNHLAQTITGSGFIEQFAEAIINPLTHPIFFTGAETILDHANVWTIGLAIIFSNWKFQQGHIYQGPVGFLFSGFAGFVFFYVMFHYGLLAGMWVHFLFDMMIFMMLFVDIWIEVQAGRNRMFFWYKTPSPKP